MCKQERVQKWIEIGNNCAVAKLYRELLEETAEETKDSKRYNVSKAHREFYGEPQGTVISKDTLQRPDFRLKLKGLIQRYATLKTREYYWSEYSSFKQFEFWHDCPMAYRLKTEKEGIRVPEMTQEWARLLIEVTFWRIQYNDASKHTVRKGAFIEHVPVPKNLRKEIERRDAEMVGRGWLL